MALKEEFKTLSDDTSAISASNAAARPSKDSVAGKLVAITQVARHTVLSNGRRMLEILRRSAVEGSMDIKILGLIEDTIRIIRELEVVSDAGAEKQLLDRCWRSCRWAASPWWRIGRPTRAVANADEWANCLYHIGQMILKVVITGEALLDELQKLPDQQQQRSREEEQIELMASTGSSQSATVGHMREFMERMQRLGIPVKGTSDEADSESNEVGSEEISGRRGR